MNARNGTRVDGKIVSRNGELTINNNEEISLGDMNEEIVGRQEEVTIKNNKWILIEFCLQQPKI